MAFTRRLCLLLTIALLMCSCSTQKAQVEEARPTLDKADAFAPLPNPYLTEAETPPPEANTPFAAAKEAMRNEQWQKAQRLLEKMTHTYPALSGPYVNLGLVYLEQNRQDKAIPAFRQAIAANPLNGDAYNQLAILHRERGEFIQAEKLYLKALDVWPHNPVAHLNLGILYDLYMGRFEDAMRHYRLSQRYAQEPERRVEGWIVDLQRRMTESRQAAVD